MDANRYIKAYAVLCIPKTEGRHSAVIAQHGGGGNAGAAFGYARRQ